MPLDHINCQILNILQENCRTPYTELAKRVGLSIDSVKKRVDKMGKNRVFNPKMQIRPRQIGFPYIVDVKVKLHNYSDKVQDLIKYLQGHKRVAELFSVSGAWDLTVVLFAKDHEELGAITLDIRKTWGHLINEWSESLTTQVHKFEEYDLNSLMEDME